MSKTRVYSAVLAFFLAVGSLFVAAQPARAESSKEKAWRIGTYALGAGTVYALAKKKGTLGLIGAAGTYLAYRQWKGEVNKRHDGRRRNVRYRRR